MRLLSQLALSLRPLFPVRGNARGLTDVRLPGCVQEERDRDDAPGQGVCPCFNPSERKMMSSPIIYPCERKRERERVAILAQVDPPLPYGGALEGGPVGLLLGAADLPGGRPFERGKA